MPKPFLPTTLAALLLIAAAAPALASADIDCDADVRVRHAAFSRCDTMTVLGPGNDSRANLLLLLLDRDMPPPGFVPPGTATKPPEADALPLLFWQEFRDAFHPPPPRTATGFADGEGSRCLSDKGGAAAFTNAVEAAGLSRDERDALVAARGRLQPECKSPTLGDASPTLSSTKGRAFAAYLRGADAFYAGRFDTAAPAFAALHADADPGSPTPPTTCSPARR